MRPGAEARTHLERRPSTSMRRTTVGTFAAVLLVMSGCGGGTKFANKPRPASPVNLTVYINALEIYFDNSPSVFVSSDRWQRQQAKAFDLRQFPDCIVVKNHIGLSHPLFVGCTKGIVTNQASTAQSVTIHRSGDSSQPLANTGPINPQATDEVAVDFKKPGTYSVSTGSGNGTDASQATHRAIRPASVHVGPARAKSSNVLLQP